MNESHGGSFKEDERPQVLKRGNLKRMDSVKTNDDLGSALKRLESLSPGKSSADK